MLVHTARLNGHPLRFFQSPLAGPDFCWHAVDDLYAALPLPPAARDDLLAGLHQRWRAEIRTVNVAGERIVIAPHWMAGALINTMAGFVPSVTDLDAAYTDAAVAASHAMLAHLGLAERLGWMMQAANRSVAEGQRADA